MAGVIAVASVMIFCHHTKDRKCFKERKKKADQYMQYRENKSIDRKLNFRERGTTG